MPIVVAEQVSKHYGSVEKPVKALDNVDLSVSAGERVALVGRSGSGKTTLLNLLAGLDQPTHGNLCVAGHSLSQLTATELAHYRCREIGVVFQSFQLLPNRNAVENVEIPLMLQGVSPRQRRQQCNEALERVGLSHRMKHRPSELSGGEQQRVAIARAIVHRPKILLADEPTGNLDSKTADRVTELLMRIVAESNATMILITHDQQLAQTCAHRIVSLSDGAIAGEANVGEATP